MKTILSSIILLLSLQCYSQNYVSINFSDTALIHKHIYIDIVNYLSNQWQIGSTVKTVFNEPFPSQVIATDTTNPYLSNDTSVFLLKIPRPYFFGAQNISTFLSFKYKLHKDSADLFKVELAADSGMHFINMLTEDTTYHIVWWGNKPNFDDTTTQWRIFQANFSDWFRTYYNQGNFPYYADADTFIFRFTFQTDSFQIQQKDGCMIDSMTFQFNMLENLDESNANNFEIGFYPNPANDILNIKRKKYTSEPEFISIYSLDGRLIETYDVSQKEFIQLHLNPGNYLLNYQVGEKTVFRKILVE